MTTYSYIKYISRKCKTNEDDEEARLLDLLPVYIRKTLLIIPLISINKL